MDSAFCRLSRDVAGCSPEGALMVKAGDLLELLAKYKALCPNVCDDCDYDYCEARDE